MNPMADNEWENSYNSEMLGATCIHISQTLETETAYLVGLNDMVDVNFLKKYYKSVIYFCSVRNPQFSHSVLLLYHFLENSD